MTDEETFASGHRKMTNPFEKCARLQARVAELEAVMDDVARTLHAHNRPSLAGRVRIECRDKLFAALQRERSNG